MSAVVHTDTYPPLERGRVAVRLIGGGAFIALALSLVGLGIVRLATPWGLTRWEDGVNTWFYRHRTPTLNSLTQIGSALAATMTCIGLLAVMFVVFRVWLGRWRESWTLLAAIAGELLLFLIVEMVVKRQRPNVPHLGVAPPTSSFPSGHMGAAVALYGCVAVIVLRELRIRWFALVIAAVCWAVPVVVGVSRLYRGMHHPTDVLFAAIGSGLWLALVLATLLPVSPKGIEQT
jgi:membrane-associated phospholipid phosphatase